MTGNPFEAPGGGAPAPPGWGSPGPPPGWGYRPPEDALARRRERTALWLGLVAWVLVLGGAVVAVIGFPLVLAFGVGLLFIAAGMLAGVVAVVLSVLSVVSAVRARGGSVLGRCASALPATVILVLATAMGGHAAVDALRPDPPDPPPPVHARTLPPSATPVEVVAEFASLAAADRVPELCLLLAERARGPGCGELVVFTLRAEEPRLVRASAERAIVAYEGWYRPGGEPRRVRLVREPAGWQLLDLPGVDDPCVDLRRDPFTCPVRTWGAPLASPR